MPPTGSKTKGSESWPPRCSANGSSLRRFARLPHSSIRAKPPWGPSSRSSISRPLRSACAFGLNPASSQWTVAGSGSRPPRPTKSSWSLAAPMSASSSTLHDSSTAWRQSARRSRSEGRMAADELVVNRVHSASTWTPGRALNKVRDHQLVIDEPTHLGGPGEQITPAEAFLAGISACGVLLVQGRARDTGVRLDQVEATIEGIRHRSDTSVFQRVQIDFRLTGPSQSEAIDLVDH